MGWGRYLLLGNLGQQLDIQDRERETAELREQFDSQWARDRNQDQQIQALRDEIRDLKLYLTSVVQLLAAKNVLSQRELADIVRAVDK